jgi:phenylalanyl-tRNA synthetase beta chain
VKVVPSPAWLVERLASVGLRSVNNVVDITNFVLMELGQPLHAFDLDKLDGRRIVVRPAKQNEPFTAIDGSTHKLHPNFLVIADATRPVAIAGVMGGRDTEITTHTQNILLESAQFDPLSVRRTSRALKLASDSSYRFERGVDPQGVDFAARRAVELILELAGGNLADGVLTDGAAPPGPKTVTIQPARCNQLLGINLQPEQIADPLDKLGFAPRLDADRSRITCTVPTFRLDLSREIDLIEEVARMIGFNTIPIHDKIQVVTRPPQPRVAARQKLTQILTAHGYFETITFTFVSPEHGDPFVPAGHQPVIIEDERRKAEPMLRASLLPSLLSCRKTNQDAGNPEVRLFECAATWTRYGKNIEEKNRLALVADATDPDQGLRNIRGSIEELFEQLHGPGEVDFQPADLPDLTSAANIRFKNTEAGRVGVISPQTQKSFDLNTRVVAAEIDLEILLAGYPPKRNARPLPRFPGTERDLSVIVDEPTRWSSIREHVTLAQLHLLEDVAFIGTYRGKPIPNGKKSVTLRLSFRDPAGTLRHEQVDPQIHALITLLKDKLGAELRA